MGTQKKIYHISEQQAAVLIQEQMTSEELLSMVGNKGNRSAYPHPVRTMETGGEEGGVGVGTKAEKPEVDLKNEPKPQELKDAWKLLNRASELLKQSAAKFRNEEMRKRIIKLNADINSLVMNANAEMNISETDLTT